jgi:hypothetical protein
MSDISLCSFLYFTTISQIISEVAIIFFCSCIFTILNNMRSVNLGAAGNLPKIRQKPTASGFQQKDYIKCISSPTRLVYRYWTLFPYKLDPMPIFLEIL